MLKLTWKSWLAVLLGIGLVFGGLFVLINAQGQPTAAYWLGFAGAVLAALWSCFALIKWRDVPWVKRVNTLVLATVGSGLFVLLFLAVDWEPGYTTTIYFYLALLGFLVGINLLRLILRPGHPILGVARTMVEESLRMGVAVIFILATLVILVLLPVIFGSEDRVTYMVQRFLTYSNMIVAVLLGLMTVLIAARTVSLEIATRQIHMTLTKPLGRVQYLLGKWLGIVLLNAVLLTVAGIATYGFTVAIAKNPALNSLDRYAVDREVLTARLAIKPEPVGTTMEGLYSNVLAEKQRADPNKFGDEGTSYAMLSDDARQEVAAEAAGRFYGVDAGKSQSQQYLFVGLDEAARSAERAYAKAQDLLVDEAGLTREQAEDAVNVMARISHPSVMDAEASQQITSEHVEQVMRILEPEVVQLSLTPSTSPKPEDARCEVLIEINGNRWPSPAAALDPSIPINLLNETTNEDATLSLPAGMINDAGEMIVTITVPENRADGVEQKSMRFNYKDNVIEVYYRVGSFEGNLARALMIVWLKLAFLAMVGLMAGSLLSFPVAAMLSLIVFVAAAMSGTINEALDSYAGVARSESTWEVITGTVGAFFSQLGAGDFYGAFKLLLRLIGESFMLLIPSFGDFNTYRPLSEGHVIETKTVANAAFRIGIIWTGIVALIGMFLFGKKEIARVQV